MRPPHPTTLKPILIIGIGNRLRQDDGFGPAVAAALRAQYGDHPALTIIDAHQLLPEMAEWIGQAEKVIFIDAAVTADAAHTGPGTLSWQPLTGNNPEASRPLSHFLTPESLITLTHLMYGKTGEFYLLTGVGREFETGEALSPPMQAAVAQAVGIIAQALAL